MSVPVEGQAFMSGWTGCTPVPPPYSLGLNKSPEAQPACFSISFQKAKGYFLFVAKRFDWVEARGADSRNHAADQSDSAENDDSDDQGEGINHKPDIAAFGVLGHSAVEREPADQEGDGVSEDDTEESSNESDGERFSQKLEEDMASPRAERLLHADFASALRDRDEHDVHQADAADAKSKGADEGQQNLEADGDDLKLVDLHHEVRDIQGAPVGGIESVLRSQDIAHGLFDAQVVVGFVIEPNGVEVVSVFKITHGGEGDINDAIDIVVAGLHLRAEDADHFVADAIEANVFADCVPSREEFLFGFGSDDGDTRALDLIFGIIEASLRQGQGADIESVGVFAIDAHRVRARIVLHGYILVATGRDVSDLRDAGGEQVHVIQGKAG